MNQNSGCNNQLPDICLNRNIQYTFKQHSDTKHLNAYDLLVHNKFVPATFFNVSLISVYINISLYIQYTNVIE